MEAPTLVIMAAGMGSRFGGLKQVTPVDDAGHPIIDFSLYDAWRAGFRRVVFVIKRELEEEFRRQVGRRAEEHFDVSYVFQELDRLPAGFSVPEGREKPWGTGHAVACCRGVVDGPFAVINADDFYGPGAFSAVFPSGDRRFPAALGLILWILVPVLVFSLSHTYYYWYVYPVLPGLCIATSILVQLCRNACRTRRQLALFACVFFLPALAALHYDRVTVSGIDDLEISGFQLDLQAAMEQRPDLHGRKIYVEKSDNEYKESFYWEQAGLLMAELSGDLKCEEGGVSAFLDETDSALLIVDPEYYGKYETQLSGLDVVYQNEYIVVGK